MHTFNEAIVFVPSINTGHTLALSDYTSSTNIITRGTGSGLSTDSEVSTRLSAHCRESRFVTRRIYKLYCTRLFTECTITTGVPSITTAQYADMTRFLFVSLQHSDRAKKLTGCPKCFGFSSKVVEAFKGAKHFQ
eukprot:3468387-Rhodomonas_salina.1